MRELGRTEQTITAVLWLKQIFFFFITTIEPNNEVGENYRDEGQRTEFLLFCCLFCEEPKKPNTEAKSFTQEIQIPPKNRNKREEY